MVRLQLSDDIIVLLPDEPDRWMIAEPRVLKRRRFECALGMRSCHRWIMSLCGNQRPRCVPTEAIHREHQPCLVPLQKLESLLVPLPNSPSSDEERKIQVRVCLEIGKLCFANQAGFI